MVYDLEERTTRFSKDLINLVKKIKRTVLNENIIKQVLRSGTSIGANYREANGAISKKDFGLKISYCKKEAKETVYWLELLDGTVAGEYKEKIKKMQGETKELALIFGKIGLKFQKVNPI